MRWLTTALGVVSIVLGLAPRIDAADEHDGADAGMTSLIERAPSLIHTFNRNDRFYGDKNTRGGNLLEYRTD